MSSPAKHRLPLVPFRLVEALPLWIASSATLDLIRRIDGDMTPPSLLALIKFFPIDIDLLGGHQSNGIDIRSARLKTWKFNFG